MPRLRGKRAKGNASPRLTDVGCQDFQSNNDFQQSLKKRLMVKEQDLENEAADRFTGRLTLNIRTQP
jgi:hypothetical protein